MRRLASTFQLLGRTSIALGFVFFAIGACSDPPDEQPSPVDTTAETTTDTTTDTTSADADAHEFDTADGGVDATDPGHDLELDDLSAPVTARYDDAGVLHLECETNLDCFRAQGYFHADDRFFEMDLIRRRTRGELTRVFGPSGLESDEKFRHFLTTADGEPLEQVFWDDLDMQTKQMFRAYAAGVNAWLTDMRNDENDATLTEEYEFPLVDTDAIRNWEPKDSVALYLQLAYQLGQKTEDDLFRGRMARKLPAETAADLFTVKPGITSNIIQASGRTPQEVLDGELEGGVDPVERMSRVRERLEPAGRAMRRAHQKLQGGLDVGLRAGGGSNSWAVAGSHTESGAALLANDPHLTLNNPPVFYLMEMNSKSNGSGDLHVAGASFPSVPSIVAGHNEDVGWSLTTARYDLADAYVEQLTDDGEAVMFEGNRVEIEEHEFEFQLASGGTETKSFEYVPHHGPLISKDMEENRGISIRWAAQEGGGDIGFIRSLMKAESIEEAKSSLEKINIVNTAWVVADRNGDIGWYPETRLPKRPWTSEHPNWLPIPGQGEAEWQGFVDRDDLPEMTNPPNGFIATANNDFDGSYTDGDTSNDDHTPWQSPPAYGHRHKRIVDMLEEGGESHTIESMNDIQSDTFSLHGEILVPLIVDAARNGTGELDPAVEDVVQTLEDWQYTCPTGIDGTDPEEASKVDGEEASRESTGCAAFHVLLPYLTDAVFGDELAEHTDLDAAAYWYKFQATLLYVFRAPGELTNGDAYFDDVSTDATESKSDIVRRALDRTADQLASVSLFDSSEPDDWRWGRIHTVTLRSFFAEADIDQFNSDTFANDGGFYTVDVATPWGRDGNFEGDFGHPVGASMRFVVEAGEEGMQTRFQLPGGQDLHRDSKWYNSLLDDWLANRHRKLAFAPEDVEEAAVETIVLGPVQ